MKKERNSAGENSEVHMQDLSMILGTNKAAPNCL